MANFLSNLFGSSESNQQVPVLSQNQIGLQDSLIQQIMSLLNGQGGVGPIGEQAINRFNTQTIPSLAERFTSMGNGQRSSAFQGALGTAGSDLQSQLAALQYGQLGQLLPSAFQQNFQGTHTPSSGGLFGAIAPTLGAAVGTAFGGPAGGFAGSAAGSSLSQILSALLGGQGQSGNQGLQMGQDMNQGGYKPFANFGGSNVGSPNNLMSLGNKFGPLSKGY